MIGVANGWAGNEKFLLMLPEELRVAYNELQKRDLAPRGFGFWNIQDEGRNGVELVKGLNSFLSTSSCDSKLEGASRTIES